MKNFGSPLGRVGAGPGADVEVEAFIGDAPKNLVNFDGESLAIEDCGRGGSRVAAGGGGGARTRRGIIDGRGLVLREGNTGLIGDGGRDMGVSCSSVGGSTLR